MSRSLPPSRSVIGRGFSFVELLFAIAVLGIGFIMLAALFPVGLQQTKLTIDETAAAGNARAASAVITKLSESLTQYINFPAAAIASNSDETNSTYVLPHTCVQAIPASGNAAGQLPVGQSRTLPGQARSLRDARGFCDVPAMSDANARRNYIWNRVSNELRTQSDERNAFALLYKRDLIATNVSGTVSVRPADVAQIIVINAQVSTQSAYTKDDAKNTTASIFNLEPRPVGVTITYDTTAGVYLAIFSSVKNIGGFANDAIYDEALNAPAEGSFLVISDDRVTTASSAGRMNGRIYRLGNLRTDLTTPGFELAPGYDFTVDPGVDTLINTPNGTGTKQDDITAIGVTGPLPVGPKGDGNLVTGGGPAIAYVLGKSFSDVLTTPGTAGSTSTYVGPAQDVALYTTFVPVK